MKLNGVVIGLVGEKLVVSFLREVICEIFAPIRYSWLNYSGHLGYLGGDGGLVDLFSI